MGQYNIIWLAITIITVLPCLSMIWMLVTRPFALDGFIKLATGYRAPLTEPPPAWFMPARLWRLTLLAVALFGLGLLLYGATIQLFSWMPLDWRNSDGQWQAKNVAQAAFIALYAPVTWLLSVLWKDRMDMIRSEQREELLEKLLQSLTWVDSSGDAYATENHERFEKRIA